MHDSIQSYTVSELIKGCKDGRFTIHTSNDAIQLLRTDLAKPKYTKILVFWTTVAYFLQFGLPLILLYLGYYFGAFVSFISGFAFHAANKQTAHSFVIQTMLASPDAFCAVFNNRLAGLKDKKGNWLRNDGIILPD